MHDPIVKKETLKIAIGTLILSVLMQSVFLILNKWDIRVLFGNLLGAFAAILNFYLMCVTVVRCMGLESDKAAMKIRASQSGRLFMLVFVAALAAMLPKVFNLVAVILPFLFSRIIITVYQLFHKENGAGQSEIKEETEK